MKLAHAMWVHGHSMQIEFPDRVNSIWRAGFYIQVELKPNVENWFHFAIPTPVIVNDNRLRAESIFIRFQTTTAYITAVDVYDGETRILSLDNLTERCALWGTKKFDVPGHPEIKWGLGISIRVRSSAAKPPIIMKFSSAGCDFLP